MWSDKLTTLRKPEGRIISLCEAFDYVKWSASDSPLCSLVMPLRPRELRGHST